MNDLVSAFELDDWYYEAKTKVKKVLRGLNCVDRHKRKLRKLEIDIERTARYMRDRAVMPYNMYTEKINRLNRLQANYMMITGHYHKVKTENLIGEKR